MDTIKPTTSDLTALLAAREVAAHHVYDAECALHAAHQAARGAADGDEAGQCDRWVAAAYTHLHVAGVEYAVATAAVSAAEQVSRCQEHEGIEEAA